MDVTHLPSSTLLGQTDGQTEVGVTIAVSLQLAALGTQGSRKRPCGFQNLHSEANQEAFL